MERHEKEKLFEEHVEALTKRKKEQFRQLLDETSVVRDVAAVLDLCRSVFFVHFPASVFYSDIDEPIFVLFQITLTTTWKEVKKLIKDDPRCIKFSSSDRVSEGDLFVNDFLTLQGNVHFRSFLFLP